MSKGAIKVTRDGGVTWEIIDTIKGEPGASTAEAEAARDIAVSAKDTAVIKASEASASALQLASGVASPAGTYANLAALISDSPDHSKIYITLDDGSWCYHNGTVWVAGGVYQASITNQEIWATLVVGFPEYPSYDTATKTLTFPAQIGAPNTINYNNGSSYSFSTQTTVVNPHSTSNVKLIFNIAAQTMEFASWSWPLTAGQRVLAVVRHDPIRARIHSTFPCKVDGLFDSEYLATLTPPEKYSGKLTSSMFEHGGIGLTGNPEAGALRIRSSPIRVSAGDTLHLPLTTSYVVKLYSSLDTSSGTFIEGSPNWIQNGLSTMPVDGFLRVVLRFADNREITLPDFDVLTNGVSVWKNIKDDFDFLEDLVSPSDIYPMFKTVTVLRGGKQLPIVDNAGKKLIFPADLNDTIFLIDGVAYPSAIPPSGLTIDLSTITGTSAWCVLFNPSDKSFLLAPWNTTINYKNTHALFATFRYQYEKYYFTMPCPFIVDDLLYGYKGITQNPLNASVKGIAHRGYSTVAPENTLPAFKLAKEKGFSYVECDVVWTSDNEPVIMHDTTINRTARNMDGTALVDTLAIKDITLDNALTYDFGIWKGVQYEGTKIPKFDEFILYCKKLNLHPYIELKATITEEQAIILVNICKKHGMIRRVTWISGIHQSLVYISNLDNSARLGFLGNLSETLIGYVEELKTEKNEVFANVEYQSVTPLLAESSFLQDIPIEVWTINHTSIANSLVDMGVIGITTDGLNIAETMYNNS